MLGPNERFANVLTDAAFVMAHPMEGASLHRLKSKGLRHSCFFWNSECYVCLATRMKSNIGFRCPRRVPFRLLVHYSNYLALSDRSSVSSAAESQAQ
jgi:hypothetical protein